MSSAVHFRFKSAKEFEHATFEGDFLKVADLKLAIVERKKLNFGENFDLEISDAQTSEVYHDENALVQKNASVVVRRVPGLKPGGILSRQDMAKKNERYAEKESALPGPLLGANSASAALQQELVQGASEADRIAAVIGQAVAAVDSMPAPQWRGRGGRMTFRGGMNNGRNNMNGNNNHSKYSRPPPATYVCYRCNKPGHWIVACPTNGDPAYDRIKVRPPTGIPRSMLKQVEAPEKGTGLQDSSGQFVTLRPNVEEFARQTVGLRMSHAVAQQRAAQDPPNGQADPVDGASMPALPAPPEALVNGVDGASPENGLATADGQLVGGVLESGLPSKAPPMDPHRARGLLPGHNVANGRNHALVNGNRKHQPAPLQNSGFPVHPSMPPQMPFPPPPQLLHALAQAGLLPPPHMFQNGSGMVPGMPPNLENGQSPPLSGPMQPPTENIENSPGNRDGSRSPPNNSRRFSPRNSPGRHHSPDLLRRRSRSPPMRGSRGGPPLRRERSRSRSPRGFPSRRMRSPPRSPRGNDRRMMSPPRMMHSPGPRRPRSPFRGPPQNGLRPPHLLPNGPGMGPNMPPLNGRSPPFSGPISPPDEYGHGRYRKRSRSPLPRSRRFSPPGRDRSPNRQRRRSPPPRSSRDGLPPRRGRSRSPRGRIQSPPRLPVGPYQRTRSPPRNLGDPGTRRPGSPPRDPGTRRALSSPHLAQKVGVPVTDMAAPLKNGPSALLDAPLQSGDKTRNYNNGGRNRRRSRSPSYRSRRLSPRNSPSRHRSPNRARKRTRSPPYRRGRSRSPRRTRSPPRSPRGNSRRPRSPPRVMGDPGPRRPRSPTRGHAKAAPGASTEPLPKGGVTESGKAPQNNSTHPPAKSNALPAATGEKEEKKRNRKRSRTPPSRSRRYSRSPGRHRSPNRARKRSRSPAPRRGRSRSRSRSPPRGSSRRNRSPPRRAVSPMRRSISPIRSDARKVIDGGKRRRERSRSPPRRRAKTGSVLERIGYRNSSPPAARETTSKRRSRRRR